MLCLDSDGKPVDLDLHSFKRLCYKMHIVTVVRARKIATKVAATGHCTIHVLQPLLCL